MTLTAAEAVEDPPGAVDAVLRVTREAGALGVVSGPAAPDLESVVVDRLPHPVAAQFARDLAALVPAVAVPSGPGPR